MGAVFPQLEIGNDPGAIREFAQAAEGLGYSYLIAYDHVLGADRDRPGGFSGVYDVHTPFHEPFVLLGYLAAVTTTLVLAPAVIVLPQRQAALVAKQAAEIDVLSGGRLRLGVGIGWNPVEYEALGQPFANRAARIEEQIEVMRRLWTEEVVSFRGRHHTIDHAGINPRPVQRPIPVWMGGSADAALERIARVADGWFSFVKSDAEGAAMLERMRGFLRAAGRNPETFPIDARVVTAKGGPDDWLATAERLRALGIRHIEINPMRTGRTVAEHVDVLRAFREGAPGYFDHIMIG